MPAFLKSSNLIYFQFLSKKKINISINHIFVFILILEREYCLNPTKIKIDDGFLKLTWDDNSSDQISLNYLRDECPCANCKGETILLKTMRPARQNKNAPGRYDITKIKVVGGYAIKISWKDGHDTGIYSWQYLKTLADDEANGKSHDYKPLI